MDREREKTKSGPPLDNSSPKQMSLTESLAKSAKDILVGLIKSGKVFSDESVASRRMKVCLECVHCRDNLACGLCHCPIKRKVKVLYAKCPDDRWEA